MGSFISGGGFWLNKTVASKMIENVSKTLDDVGWCWALKWFPEPCRFKRMEISHSGNTNLSTPQSLQKFFGFGSEDEFGRSHVTFVAMFRFSCLRRALSSLASSWARRCFVGPTTGRFASDVANASEGSFEIGVGGVLKTQGHECA